MGVKITDNTDAIRNNLKVRCNVFLRLFVEDVVKSAEPNTPKKSGELRKDIIKRVLGLKAKIIWHRDPYALIQETTQFLNYTTPGTGPHFAENAINDTLKKDDEIAKRSGLTSSPLA